MDRLSIGATHLVEPLKPAAAGAGAVSKVVIELPPVLFRARHLARVALAPRSSSFRLILRAVPAYPKSR